MSLYHTDLMSAGAFYGFKTIIVPHNLPPEILSAHLQKAQAEALIAEAGALDLSLVAKGNKQLSRVVWVAKLGSRHMDWNDVPEDVQGSLSVAVWHELVDERRDLAGFEVPSWDPASPAPEVTTVWPSSSDSGEFIDYQPQVSPLRLLSLVLTWTRTCRPASARWVLPYLAISGSTRTIWSCRSIPSPGRTPCARSCLLFSRTHQLR